MLTRSDFEAGVREWQTRFFVRCAVCAREEMRGALPALSDTNPNLSAAAKRMRTSCSGEWPAPCRFEQEARLVKLEYTDALRLDLVAPAPLLRLRGDDGEAMFAVKLDRRPTIREIAALGEMAEKAFEALAGEDQS